MRHLLFALLLLHCRPADTPEPPEQTLARDLTQPGDYAPDPSAAQADSEFQACHYVYETPEGLRECLVVQHHWTPEAAARRIAIEVARVRHRMDSAQMVLDSLRLTRLRGRDRLDGPIARTFPDSGAWMADDRTRGFYRTTCAAAQRIPVRHRVYFTTREDATAAGLWASAQPGC